MLISFYFYGRATKSRAGLLKSCWCPRRPLVLAKVLLWGGVHNQPLHGRSAPPPKNCTFMKTPEHLPWLDVIWETFKRKNSCLDFCNTPGDVVAPRLHTVQQVSRNTTQPDILCGFRWRVGTAEQNVAVESILQMHSHTGEWRKHPLDRELVEIFHVTNAVIWFPEGPFFSFVFSVMIPDRCTPMFYQRSKKKWCVSILKTTWIRIVRLLFSCWWNFP